MVNEVNKIVANILLSGREVRIGDLGTLFIRRYAAFRASRKSLTPSYRTIEFTSELRGSSLEDEIAILANVDRERAHDIFSHWLSEVSDSDTIRIDGVGTLRHHNFSVDESFSTTLNPNGRTPIRLKPKANVVLYLFASLSILFALAIAGYVYIDSNDISLFNTKEIVADAVPQEQAEEQNVQSELPAESVKESEMVELQTDQSEIQHTTISDVDTNDILSTTSGRSYVVLGVFSTSENAKRAIFQVQNSMRELHCSIYHYGNKYMVSLYDAPNRSECQEFIHSLGDAFKDLWIYSRK